MGDDYYLDEGWCAYYDGYDENECPYQDGSFAAGQWKLGWYQALKYERKECGR